MESIGHEPKPQSTLPTEDQIRARAYEIYQTRAGGPGNPENDWIQAQRELTAAMMRRDGVQPSAKAAATPAKSSIVSPPAVAQADGVMKSSPALKPEPVVKTVAQPARKAARGKSSR